MGRLLKQFRLKNGENGSELSIVNPYTDGVVYYEFLYDGELKGLYNTLKKYLEGKGIIDEETW